MNRYDATIEFAKENNLQIIDVSEETDFGDYEQINKYTQQARILNRYKKMVGVQVGYGEEAKFIEFEDYETLRDYLEEVWNIDDMEDAFYMKFCFPDEVQAWQADKEDEEDEEQEEYYIENCEAAQWAKENKIKIEDVGYIRDSDISFCREIEYDEKIVRIYDRKECGELAGKVGVNLGQLWFFEIPTIELLQSYLLEVHNIIADCKLVQRLYMDNLTYSDQVHSWYQECIDVIDKIEKSLATCEQKDRQELVDALFIFSYIFEEDDDEAFYFPELDDEDVSNKIESRIIWSRRYRD